MNQRDAKVFDIHSVDLKSGKVELDTENPGDVANWQADNDGQIRSAQVQTPDGGTIIRVRDDKSRRIGFLAYKEARRCEPSRTTAGMAHRAQTGAVRYPRCCANQFGIDFRKPGRLALNRPASRQ